MALLGRATITVTHEQWREPIPQPITPQDLTADTLTVNHRIHRMVRINMPEQDWYQIEEILRMWEEDQRHPAVQQAWEQLMITRRLTQRR